MAAATNNNNNNNLMRRDAKERRCRSPTTLTVRKEAGTTANVPKVVRSRSSSSASSSSAAAPATKSVSKTLSKLATSGKNVVSTVNPKSVVGSLRLGGDPGKVAVGKKTTSTATVAAKKSSEARASLGRSISTGSKVAVNSNGKGLVKSSMVSAAKVSGSSSKVVPEKKKLQISTAKGKIGGGGNVFGKSVVKKGVSPRSESSLASVNGRRKGEPSLGATKSNKPVVVSLPEVKEQEQENEDDIVIMDVGDSEESLLSEETDDQILESLPDPYEPTKPAAVDFNLKTTKSPEAIEDKIVIDEVITEMKTENIDEVITEMKTENIDEVITEMKTENIDEVKQQTPNKETEEPVSAPQEEAAEEEKKVKVISTQKETTTKQAYNDVIEETAGKLVGKGKNKVLALAGAFQTVISLQEPGIGTTYQASPSLQRRNAAEEKSLITVAKGTSDDVRNESGM
ncbi:hypothetical protein ZOSMA_125G00500 [Zostera marina]|uniref:Calmodulin-binding domain-containing protein n=1 Tax=Zostera marina TaxID=29655 RepID=A0A0K9Q237_ZOSMR|nr:hypothetical protein ZOSMA_125G00500 [Zostera marina]